jgi:predicted dehydrogenase
MPRPDRLGSAAAGLSEPPTGNQGGQDTWVKPSAGASSGGEVRRDLRQGIAASQTGTLAAIGSRTQESADRFGDEYNVPRRHASYEALLADPEVDVVHISLPNHLHAEWTVRCAEAGKHILCEKPFTVNHAEAVRTLEAVKRHDVFFMEAFMYRCHPQTARLAQLLAEKAIGEVRLIQCNFCYNMGPGYENIRMRRDVAGGGIMDVGCYTVSMARLVAGAEPDQVTGAAHIGPISRVDEQATASLRFPSGAVANLACATQVATDNDLRVWGSEGSIRVPNPWFPGESGNKIVVQRADEKTPEEIMVDGGAPLYAIEADTVARHLGARQAPPPCMTSDDTLGNMAALDAWRRAVGLAFDGE